MSYRIPRKNAALNYRQKAQAAIVLEMIPKAHFDRYGWQGYPVDLKDMIHLLEIAEVFLHGAPDSFKEKLAKRIEEKTKKGQHELHTART
jgi:hypothetical protein